MLIRLKALFYSLMRWVKYAKTDAVLIWKTSRQLRKLDRFVRNNIPGGWGFLLAMMMAIIVYMIIHSIGIMGLIKILIVNTIIVAIVTMLVIFVPQIIEECRL